MSDLSDITGFRRAELIQMKANVSHRLKKLKYKGDPQCHIRIDTKRNCFYLDKDGKGLVEKGMFTDEKAAAEQIANYDYLKNLAKIIDQELKIIDKCLKKTGKTSAEDYYGTLCKGRQDLIIPIRQTDEQYVEEWLSGPYEGGSFGVGDAEYYTEKNERVRSKSEILIANALKKHGVPYKYECPLYLEGLGVIHPDFTALNVRRRKILYWEHLGKMDDEDYANKNVNRINIYEKNGLFKGEKLILTWETSKTPLDVLLLDSVIKHYLLE